MAQPAGWVWGLAPLALLWALGNLQLAGPIQQDVARRAAAAATAAAGGAPGARPVSVAVSGRDVAIAGEALSADGAARAAAQLRSEFGVRRVIGGLTQVVAQRPYSWSASREGDVVALMGHVPDEAAAAANLAAARAAVPGARIEDGQRLAFGAPPDFAGTTRALIGELARVSRGKVALDDSRFCIEGQARSSGDYAALQAAAGSARPGFQPVPCAIEPPLVQPWRWSVARGADGAVVVEGFLPSPAAREEMLGALRRAFPPPLRIEDRAAPARGAPQAFLARMQRAISDVARLRAGRADLEGDVYRLAGQGPESFEACEALRLLIAQTDGPDSVAQATIECPPAPAPIVMPALPDIPALVLPPPEPPAVAPAPEPVSPAPEPQAVAPASEPTPPEVAAPAPSPAPAQDVVVPALPEIPPPSAQSALAPPPPPQVPLRWSAEWRDGVLRIAGLVRDAATRDALIDQARGLLAATGVEPALTLEPNLREGADYLGATRFAIDLARRLSRGAVAIAGDRLSLAGEAATPEAISGLLQALQTRPLPGGLVLESAPASLALRPYPLGMTLDRGGLALSGYLPDEATRAALLALVEASPLRGKALDETVIAPGAPAPFAAAARAALANLLRLDLGSARLDETGLTLRGLTCRDLIKTEVETGAATGLPPGLAVDAAIGLRQTGCVIDPPNTCQNDLDALTKRNSVMFAQGTTVVNLDPTTERVIGEAFAILKQCPDSRIVIEGHANFDGERSGFDNRDLSERRALRVRDELVRRGLAPGQLSVRGFGVERPLQPHGSAEAKAVNRRVQFTVAK